MQTNPKFAFFGTPYVARDTLAYLAEHGFVPTVVVTSPDVLRGRGLALTPTDTKLWALEHHIPVVTPENIDAHACEEIVSYGCIYGVVVAYGKILTSELIESFPQGLINVHYSLLPKYRGASPVESALLAGDTVTGVALQKLVRELDAGDLLAVQEVAIQPNETTRELRPRLIQIGAELLVATLPKYLAGEIKGEPQDSVRATRARKISKSEGELNLTDPAEQNWNKYRAYAESPGTYFFVDKGNVRMRVKITKAALKNGVFTVERVIPEGKKEMNYAEFVSRSRI